MNYELKAKLGYDNDKLLQLNQTIAIFRYHVVYDPVTRKLVLSSNMLSKMNERFFTQNKYIPFNWKDDVPIREKDVQVNEDSSGVDLNEDNNDDNATDDSTLTADTEELESELRELRESIREAKIIQLRRLVDFVDFLEANPKKIKPQSHGTYGINNKRKRIKQQ